MTRASRVLAFGLLLPALLGLLAGCTAVQKEAYPPNWAIYYALREHRLADVDEIELSRLTPGPLRDVLPWGQDYPMAWLWAKPVDVRRLGTAQTLELCSLWRKQAFEEPAFPIHGYSPAYGLRFFVKGRLLFQTAWNEDFTVFWSTEPAGLFWHQVDAGSTATQELKKRIIQEWLPKPGS